MPSGNPTPGTHLLTRLDRTTLWGRACTRVMGPQRMRWRNRDESSMTGKVETCKQNNLILIEQSWLHKHLEFRDCASEVFVHFLPKEHLTRQGG